jgi:hypothetical protein
LPSSTPSSSRAMTATTTATVGNLTISATTTHQRAAHWVDEHGTHFRNPWPSAHDHPVSDGHERGHGHERAIGTCVHVFMQASKLLCMLACVPCVHLEC